MYYVKQTGDLASLLSWLIFGAFAVPAIGGWLKGPVVVYALLSLTVVRMLPVALSLLGAGLGRAGVAFIGWFGPRGLASVVFALLALEDLNGVGEEMVATIGLTVLLSVVAHGLSAAPLARRFGKAQALFRRSSRAAPRRDARGRRLSARSLPVASAQGSEANGRICR